MKVKELEIDGFSIFIEELEQLNKAKSTHDAGGLSQEVFKWSANQLQNALKPVATILNSLRESVKDITPDEMELSMQFELAISGETPVLKIVSAESKCQIAAKFVWKKEN